MEVIGYSERGIINSLFYEMKFSQNHLQLLNHFVSMVCFPYWPVDFQIAEATILIEQSFSDFGDSDAVLLLDNHGNKQVVFLEAKVKTLQKRYWSIVAEFEELKTGIDENRVSSSNLFMQLYHKVRLVKALQRGGIGELQGGVRFPSCSSKEWRRIGSNRVVLGAVDQVDAYCMGAFFIALVPDDIANLRAFYERTLKDYSPEGFQEWDIGNWGYLSWSQVEEFCRRHDLAGTLRTFAFNEGQIY